MKAGVIHPTKAYSGIVLVFRGSSPSLVETQLLTHLVSREKHWLCDLRVQSRAVLGPRTSRRESRLVTCVICDVAFRQRYYQRVPSGCCLFLLFLQLGAELTCFWATERGVYSKHVNVTYFKRSKFKNIIIICFLCILVAQDKGLRAVVHWGHIPK